MFKQATILHEIKDAEGKVTQACTTISRNGLNQIISIHIRARLEDDKLIKTKDCDFLIEGDQLAAIQGDIATGVQAILKEKAKVNYTDWQEDLAKTVSSETILDTPQKVTDQFGVTKITKI